VQLHNPEKLGKQTAEKQEHMGWQIKLVLMVEVGRRCKKQHERTSANKPWNKNG
jgi:hypothetical protein